MRIVSVTRNEVSGFTVVHIVNGAEATSSIPEDTQNSDFKKVVDWQVAGGVVGPYVAPVVGQEDVDAKLANLDSVYAGFISLYAEREGLTESDVLGLIKSKVEKVKKVK